MANLRVRPLLRQPSFQVLALRLGQLFAGAPGALVRPGLQHAPAGAPGAGRQQGSESRLKKGLVKKIARPFCFAFQLANFSFLQEV